MHQARVYETDMRFAMGLKLHTGDPVYMLPSGFATNQDPNGGGLRSLFTKLGFRRRTLAIRVGIVVSAERYYIDGTCKVLVS